MCIRDSYNPIGTLLGSAVSKLPASHAAYLTGHAFFPALIAAPFQQGLDIAFDLAIAACLVAAVASLLRGRPSGATSGTGQAVTTWKVARVGSAA